MNQPAYLKITVLFTIILICGNSFLQAKTITTTSLGGLWEDATTWIGEIVPTKNDDVVITSEVTTGNVYYSSRTLEANNLTINEGGKIIREADRVGYYSMEIHGNLENNGEIIDYLDYFDIRVHGNIVNNGILKPRYLTLNGENQHISATKPISPKTFFLRMTDQQAFAASDLHFHNSDVQGDSGKKLDMKSFKLKLSADSITYSSYYGELRSDCIIRIPLVFENTGTIDLNNSIFQGTIQGDVLLRSSTLAILSDLTIEGNLTVERGTKVSSSENLIKLKVTEDFYNYGQLNNDTIPIGEVMVPPRSMTATIYGDVANYGSTGNTNIHLTTNGETRTIRGDYAGNVKFQQSEGNETPGGKVIINEEVSISGRAEVYTTVEITASGTLNLLYRGSSTIYIRDDSGELINHGSMFRHHYVNNSWFYYHNYTDQPGTFVDYDLRDWDGQIDGIDISVHNNQTYPGLPGSTKRWWRIKQVGDGDVTNYTIKFYYDETLLNGQKEENLKVYRSMDEGETWEVVSVTEEAVLDTVENFISIGVWHKDESMLTEFGDFVISAGDGSVPIADNFKIDMVGRPDVRIGAPNPFTIHVYNVTDFFTGPILLAMDVTDDIRFKEIHLPYNDGVEILQVDSISDPDDLTQVFFIPYLEPNEHYSFDVIVYGITDNMKSAAEGMVTLSVGGYFGDQAKGAAVDFLVEQAGKAVDLNPDEKEEYARGMGLAVKDLASDKKQYGKTVSTIRNVSKYTIGKIAETNPVTKVLFKIGEGVEAVYSIKDSLRRRLWHWLYKQTGLYGVEEKVVSGKQVEGELVTSWDPNEMVGPAGFGDQNHIAEIPRMNYTIYFENLKDATAPAYRIQVVDTLSALFNPETVKFAETSHSGTGYNWKMEREGNILKWDIEGIELPPNVTPPEGEGFVRFSVDLAEGLPSGTTIENRATIVFDMNPPITTNTWVNVLDFEAPTTLMNPINYSAGDTLITVSCHASDNENGSGVRMYEFFASIDNGPFHSLGQSASNSIKYQISDSTKNNYRFYALVEDHVGNAGQIIPELEELNSLLVSAEINDNLVSTLSIYPNPIEKNMNIGFLTETRSQLTLKFYSINGKLLNTTDKGWFQPGKHHVSMDVSFLSPGIYLVEAITDLHTEKFKLIKK